jgi:zinc protease
MMRLARNLALGASLLAGCGGSPAPQPEGQAADGAAVDRTKLPEPGKTPEWEPPAPERWTLANGIEVWFLRQKQAPLVSLRMLIPRGSATDPQGMAGMTALAADMLDEGTGTLSSLEISETLQRLATDYDAHVDTDATSVAMNMLADQFEPSVTLLSDLVLRPAFPPEEFERRKAQHLAGAIAAEADPGFARGVVLRRVLFGDGYGGAMPSGTRETIPKLDLAGVKAHYGKIFAPKGAAIIVVGDVERSAVEPVLAKAFGEWKAEPGAEAAKVAEVKPERAIYLVDFPGASQSSLAVARRAPGMKAAEDYFPAMVFNWSLGGSFGSRLNLNLREDKGYTYGARAGFNRWREAGFYYMAANVKTEVTKESIQEMFSELSRLTGEKPLTAEERQQAVSGLLLGLPGDWERMEAVASQFVEIPLYDRPADWFENFPEKIRDVSLDAASSTAKKYADPGDYLVVVAGDRSVLEPALKDLGLPIKLYDARGNPQQ